MSQLLDRNGRTEAQYLQQYNANDYPRPSTAVDIVIFSMFDVQGNNNRKLSGKELRILLVRRGGHPCIGQWALPGGFVRENETVGEAASRELMEEAGIQGGYLEQLYTFSRLGRDKRGWIMSCAHMALRNSSHFKLKAGSDADDARWFTLTAENKAENINLSLSNEDINLSAIVASKSPKMEFELIENNGLAFDHSEIVACAINRLRAKLKHSDLAFNLVSEKFTMSELQQVYEAILSKSLAKAAFRKKIKAFVVETGESTQEGWHRRAKLFTHRKEE